MSRSSEKTTHPFDEGVAEAIAEALRPEELPAGRRAAMLDRISGLIADQPPQTRTIRADGVDWISFSPHVWVKTLRQDADRNLQMVLFRMEPGGVVPAHEHTKEESAWFWKVKFSSATTGSVPVICTLRARARRIAISRREPALWSWFAPKSPPGCCAL